MRRVAAALAIASAFAVGGPAPVAAQWPTSLPVDGTALDLGTHESATRLVVRGTMTSSLDGSELDAWSRWGGDRRDASAWQLIDLPRGARLIEADPAAHVYIFELPAGTPVVVRSKAHVWLAIRQLVTPSEAVASLTGAFTVEASWERDGNAPSGAAPDGDDRAGRELTVVGGVSALTLGAAIVALFLLARRRARVPVRALARRGRAAVRAVVDRARALGPAFTHVEIGAQALAEDARGAYRHALGVEHALDRTRRVQGSEEARLRRDALVADRDGALARLERIVTRLEATAVALAATAAARLRPGHVERDLTALAAELDVALAAEEEARQTAPI